jgi:hypothetical protein
MNGSGSNSLICAIRGPVMLITIGALFAFNNFTPYGFGSTWPVLLIVFGLLSLACRGANPAPHAETPAGTPPPAPPYGYPPPPSTGYRQSAYTQPPPPGTAKGGFGTSAPPRPAEPVQPPPENPGGSV